MPLCEVVLALKMNGARHAPGSVIDISDEQLALLPEGTVCVADALPPAPEPVKPPKPPAEKVAAVKAAKVRVAKATEDVTPLDSPAVADEG